MVGLSGLTEAHADTPAGGSYSSVGLGVALGLAAADEALKTKESSH